MWTAVQVMETCMRDLRFTRVVSQTVAVNGEDGLTFMYDTPRPAKLVLDHETEPLSVEIIYGGFIPMSEQAIMFHPARPVRGVAVDEEEPPHRPPEERVDEENVDRLLVTRGVNTAPDHQVRFFDADSGELLGVVILDAKYKGGRKVWRRSDQRMTDDRLLLQSYLLDIHRADREDASMARPSQPADDIVLGAYALFPGERYGQDLRVEDRLSGDRKTGAIRVSPDSAPSEELTQMLLEAMAQAVRRRVRVEEPAPELASAPVTPLVGETG